MHIIAAIAASFAGVAAAFPAPPLTQAGDGQIQASSAQAVGQIGDDQVQVTPSPMSLSVSGWYFPLPCLYNQQPTLDTAMLAMATSIAGLPASEIPGANIPAYPVISSQITGVHLTALIWDRLPLQQVPYQTRQSRQWPHLSFFRPIPTN
jgi:hypothetical protein